jgi:hypothetical protein
MISFVGTYTYTRAFSQLLQRLARYVEAQAMSKTPIPMFTMRHTETLMRHTETLGNLNTRT